DQVTRIAGAILCLRDKWSEQMVRATLAHPEISRRDARAVAIAFTACATDPDTKHPNRLLEMGSWWDLVKWTSDDTPAYRYTNPRDCGTCGFPEKDCRGRTDAIGHEYAPVYLKAEDRATPDQIAAVRAVIAAKEPHADQPQ